MPRGWFDEPGRHALAAKGIKTAKSKTRKVRPFKPEPKQGLEPSLIGRHLTGKQVKKQEALLKDFLWPGEKIHIKSQGEMFGEERFKMTVSREPWSKWRKEYPMDDEARPIYYERDSQVHLEMKPTRFLSQVTWQTDRKLLSPEQFKGTSTFYRPSYDKLMERLEKKQLIDPLFLDLNWDGKRWEVYGHEGRHRAVASYDSNVARVPVLVFIKVDRYYTPIWKLTNEQTKTLRKKLEFLNG